MECGLLILQAYDVSTYTCTHAIIHDLVYTWDSTGKPVEGTDECESADHNIDLVYHSVIDLQCPCGIHLVIGTCSYHVYQLYEPSVIYFCHILANIATIAILCTCNPFDIHARIIVLYR